MNDPAKPICPTHDLEMRRPIRAFAEGTSYFFCPKPGCGQRYRESEGYFLSTSTPKHLTSDPSRRGPGSAVIDRTELVHVQPVGDRHFRGTSPGRFAEECTMPGCAQAAILEGLSEPLSRSPTLGSNEFDRLPTSVHGPIALPRSIHEPNSISLVFTYSYERNCPLNNGAVLKLSCFPVLPFPKGMVSICSAGQLVV